MSDLSEFFDKVWDGLLSFLKDAYEWALPIVKAALQSLLKGGGATLMDAAMNAVKAAEATDADGDSKWEMAYDAVKQTLESEGREVVKSAVNLAIEMAVAKLKEQSA